MNDNPSLVIACVLAFLLGVLCGWLIAHGEVRNECIRLGGFYVGNNTFACQLKDTNK